MNKDIRLSTDYFGHAKVIKLGRRLGDAGILSHLRLLTYVGSHKPDGILTGMDIDDIGIASNYSGDANQLVQTLIELRLIDCIDGVYQIHDWAENNPYAAGAKARSDKAKQAAQKMWEKRKASLVDDTQDATSMPQAKTSNAPSPSPSPSPEPITPQPPRGGRRKRDSEMSPRFLEVMEWYPKRSGCDSLPSAWSAFQTRVAEGVDPEEMLSAVPKYFAWCEATGKIGTDLVMQKATFFGPQKQGWKGNYDLAPKVLPGAPAPKPWEQFEEGTPEYIEARRKAVRFA